MTACGCGRRRWSCGTTNVSAWAWGASRPGAHTARVRDADQLPPPPPPSCSRRLLHRAQRHHRAQRAGRGALPDLAAAGRERAPRRTGPGRALGSATAATTCATAGSATGRGWRSRGGQQPHRRRDHLTGGSSGPSTACQPAAQRRRRRKRVRGALHRQVLSRHALVSPGVATGWVGWAEAAPPGQRSGDPRPRQHHHPPHPCNDRRPLGGSIENIMADKAQASMQAR